MRRFLLLVCTSLAASTVYAQKECSQLPYQQKALTEDPAMASRVQQIENFIQSKIQQSGVTVNGSTPVAPQQINIPVVVHSLYNSADQNLSEARILAQIASLNKDFAASNDDISKITAYFSEYVANSTGIRFALAKIDPAGKATNGIVRKKTSIGMYGLDDRAKYSNAGGNNAWDASRYLNIWVCDLSSTTIGYAQFPGGPANTDGVVCDYFYFGRFGSAHAPYNLGRTATHEIGHWLNCYHIWGDDGTGCNGSNVDYAPSRPPMKQSLTLIPIGFARTPLHERVFAPRQPGAAGAVCGTLELEPGRGFQALLPASQIEKLEFVGDRGGRVRRLQVNAPDPVSVFLEKRDEMVPDEAAGTGDEDAHS